MYSQQKQGRRGAQPSSIGESKVEECDEDDEDGSETQVGTGHRFKGGRHASGVGLLESN